MSIQPVGVTSFLSVGPVAAGVRGSASVASPDSTGDAAVPAVTAPAGAGLAGTSLPDSATISQQALAAGQGSTTASDAATQQAAADEAITMPATPLAHILVQLRAVVRAQRAAGQASKAIVAQRPGTTKEPGQPHSKEAVKVAAKAYVKVQQGFKGGAQAHAVDVYADNG